MKKQFAALLALSTAAACVLSYQPVQAGAESVLGSMTQENLTDITNEQKDAFYQSSLGEIEPSAEPSELEQAATANGMYKDTFSFEPLLQPVGGRLQPEGIRTDLEQHDQY